MQALRHPNVLQFLGWYRAADGALSIVTELCAASLDQLLHKSRLPIPPHHAVSMALDIARGLQYLHAQHIVHRDIKSANLLLVDLHSCRLKVADFGLAKSLAHSVLGVASRVGTLTYEAPEVLAGGLAGTRSDIYSLGVVFCEAPLLYLLSHTAPHTNLHINKNTEA